MDMKSDRKRMYVLTALILAVTLLLLAAFTKDDGESDSADVPANTPAPYADESAPESLQPTEEPGETMNTTVYYQDNYGYLVPVTRTIRAEKGVARATVNLMVKSVYNDMEAARLGLRTVIPENTTFDLDISGGTARIDLSEEALSCADEQAEKTMISAVVQTLTTFPTVEKVRFLFDGQERKAMKHGTDVSGDFTRATINPETEIPGGSSAVTLYFTGDSPSMIVPVTRAVFGKADISTAVLELAKGPSVESPLEPVLPTGCGLIGVELTNGVARINFSDEFIRIAENTDGGRLAMRALALTCSQFDGVKKVEILVDGEPYDPGEGTLAMPTFINSASDIADAFIVKQSGELFDFE